MSRTNAVSAKAIGLVAWQALPAIDSSHGKSVGGLETGAWTLAKGLAASQRFDVTLFVAAKKIPSHDNVCGVRISSSVNRIEAIRREVSSCLDVVPRLRLKHWSIQLIWQIPFLLASRPWRQAPLVPMATDPRLISRSPKIDIWCGFGANGDSARVAATAKELGRPMLLFLESNADLVHSSENQTDLRNAYGETEEEQLFAIRNATRVICQNRWQLLQLKERFNIDGDLIRNPIDINEWIGTSPADRQGVLWIGRYDNFHKRTNLAIEIARRCPEIPFQMIINRSGLSRLEDDIRRTCPPNVEIIDFVPFSEISKYFNASKIFLSTGHPDHEGFPNVLLQAAASKTPTVSLFDFDGFLSDSGAGVGCNDDLNHAVRAIHELDSKCNVDWTQVHEYLNREHSVQVVVDNVNRIIQSLDQANL